MLCLDAVAVTHLLNRGPDTGGIGSNFLVRFRVGLVHLVVQTDLRGTKRMCRGRAITHCYHLKAAHARRYQSRYTRARDFATCNHLTMTSAEWKRFRAAFPCCLSQHLMSEARRLNGMGNAWSTPIVC